MVCQWLDHILGVSGSKVLRAVLGHKGGGSKRRMVKNRMMKGEMCRILSVDQHYIQAFG